MIIKLTPTADKKYLLNRVDPGKVVRSKKKTLTKGNTMEEAVEEVEGVRRLSIIRI